MEVTPAASTDTPDRVLVIMAHPRKDSFCAALARAYTERVSTSCETRTLHLGDLVFNPNVVEPSPVLQPLEPDLIEARKLLFWANHWVIIFPTWWATMPAMLKGFFDRVLLPDEAFLETDKGYKPLLTGRTAHLITTMDTPEWVYQFIYRSPGIRAIAHGTLGLCGVRPVRVTRFAAVRHSTPAMRERWLEDVRREAEELPAWKHRLRQPPALFSWLRISRLHFYAMTLLAYGLGSRAAVLHEGAAFQWPIFWVGFGILFLIEWASVLTNEIHDLPSDRLNKNHGPFTGGSRVLCTRALDVASVKRVRSWAAGLAALLGLALIPFLAESSKVSWFLALGVGLVLGIGYTAPPMQLGWRGLGETTVAFTHSIYMVLCGWIIQGAAGAHPTPWMMGLPMGLAVFAANLLAGVPDYDADKAVGKRSLPVILGIRTATILATVAAVAAGVFGIIIAGVYDSLPSAPVAYLFGIHLLILTGAVGYFTTTQSTCRRIDGLLFLALSFILWFVLVPLLRLT